MLFLKYIYDNVRPGYEKLFERYIDVVGSGAALVIGTNSVEMIMQGARTRLRM